MAEYTLELMRRFRFEPHDGLDLCCGTGSALKYLSDHGLAMSGLDRSPQMLTVARRKLKGRGLKLFRRELPHFLIAEGHGRPRRPRHFDLVTSFFDSLNYLLTAKARAATFRNVRRHLRPGGYFVFDMNTPHALKAVWGGSAPFAKVIDDAAWFYRTSYSEKTGIAGYRTAIFLKKARRWERADEVHFERGYSNAEIKALLRAAGFRIRGFYRCLTFDPPDTSTNRICAVAQRRNSDRSRP